MKEKRQFSRRDFLKVTAGTTTAAIGAPMIIPNTVFGQDEKTLPPSERITVGHIGVGNQGGHLFRSIQRVKEAHSVAVADCFKSRREGHAAACKGKAYHDFRDLLARDDIDCVVIAVPDHWHVPIAVMAARSKKSVYLEKPLSLSIEQNLLCQKVFAENKQIFQYGTQQRGQSNCWLGCTLVRKGILGKIHTIEVDAPNGGAGGSTAEVPIPPDLGEDGYEMWLGPAPKKPYTHDRCKPNGTYLIYDQSIGYLGGWGSHPLDIMVWGCDADLSGTINVEGTGIIPTEGLYDTIYNWNMKIKLGEVNLIFKHGSDRTRFIGEHGWIEVRRNGTSASNPELLKTPIDDNTTQIFKAKQNHYADFINGVKTRTAPTSTLKDAVRSDNISHLCNIAVRTKSVVKWDPVNMKLINPTAEQSKMISRPLREPWTL
ncbi:MAG: Gfo/Idh/MocA family oxidoreductase [Planctomycetaceae bacterium]|jgi:predicted dehydrogenase|nr:Gfo/Idh/MocA family oxidoreductase [Planctomycetaceae bacterium]